MIRRFAFPTAVLLAALATPAAHAQSGAERWEVGPRFTLLTAGGVPSNDMFGPGVFVRYRARDRWLVGFAVDSIAGDFERPYEIVGLASPEEIDSTIETLVVSGWIEREHGRPDRKLHWFWSVGVGFASPDADDVTGPRVGGGTFDISTDAGSEILASVGAGLRYRFGRRWGFEAGVHVDRHFADWELTDRVSGRTGAIDDYTTRGVRGGLTYRF